MTGPIHKEKVSRLLLITTIVLGIPFVVLHLVANPDDAPISMLQHIAAAFANFFGPWGVAIVRLVDFPNAGMRSFNLGIAVGLTLALAAAVYATLQARRRGTQVLAYAGFVLLMLFWLGLGLVQIADGLL